MKARKKSGKNPGREPFTEEEIKRLNRVIGQVEGIRNMMESGRALDEILAQCKAVHSALKSVETRLLRRHVDAAMEELMQAGKRKEREERLEALVELYRPV